MSNTKLACIILAGGKSSRMKTGTPKVLHKIAGLPLINWLLKSVDALNPDKIVVVTSPHSDEAIKATVTPHETVIQKEAKGTGDAVKAALPLLDGFDGHVLILLGDMPLLTPESMVDLIDTCHEENTGLSVLGVDIENPPAFGRLVMKGGILERIVEDKDCTEEERKITICNTGAFCVNGTHLHRWVNQIGNDNAQGEYYITDLPEIAAKEDSLQTRVSILDDDEEALGVNDRIDLAQIEYIKQLELRVRAMESGVTLIDPQTVYFSYDTALGQDILIEPHVFFGEGVNISDGVVIHAFSHIEGAQIGAGVSVGPFARIRPQSVLEENVSVGNFTEINRSTLKTGSKAKHVSYLGDVTVGAKCNVGAGTVVANYDGYEKHKSTFGAGSFIGSNSTIVAPVSVGEDAIVAAGSTITMNVPDEALAIARVEGDVRPGWALERRKKKTG